MNVSVAMCTYNGERYLEKQLKSILSQTYPIDEIVICDDCSSDKTREIIHCFITKGLPIRMIENDRRLGYHKNFQKSYSLCRGDIVFFCDQDDEWLPEKVEETISFFNHHPNVKGVCTDGILINDNDESIGSTLFHSAGYDLYQKLGTSTEELFSILIIGNNYVTGATIAVLNGSIHDFMSSSLMHDFFIALDLSSKSEFDVIEKPLIRYRIHSQQSVGVQCNPKQYYMNSFKLYSGQINLSLYSHYWKRRRNIIHIKHQFHADPSLSAVSLCHLKIKTIDLAFEKERCALSKTSFPYWYFLVQKRLNRFLELLYPLYFRWKN